MIPSRLFRPDSMRRDMTCRPGSMHCSRKKVLLQKHLANSPTANHSFSTQAHSQKRGSQSAERAMPPKPPSIALAALRAGAKKPQPHPTHFTATGPHASTQPPPRITTIDVPAGAANETPRQKVARLREAARVARVRDLPWHDKLVETTRVWADVTHRWFIVFIMMISGGHPRQFKLGSTRWLCEAVAVVAPFFEGTFGRPCVDSMQVF
jgi:hypothetical protein